MFKMLKNGVLRKGIITTKYPKEPIKPCDGVKGLPVVTISKCVFCGDCIKACPVDAIHMIGESLEIDVGACIFCGSCERACGQEAIKMTPMIELASKKREELKVKY